MADKTTKELFSHIVNKEQKKVEIINTLLEEYKERGLNREGVERWYDAQADWVAVLSFVKKNWQAPLSTTEFKNTPVGKAFDRLLAGGAREH